MRRTLTDRRGADAGSLSIGRGERIGKKLIGRGMFGKGMEEKLEDSKNKFLH